MPETFNSAHEVRAFLKPKGFTKIKVRYANNPFGGAGKYFVSLTDIPAGTTLIHSSGSQTPATTFSSDGDVGDRIAKLREELKGTNAAVDH